MVQECGFHVSPLFGIKFLQDCYKFLQIQSHITTLHYLHNISGGVNVLYLKKSTVQQIFQNSISQNIKCMEIDGLPSPGYKKCSHITHFIANYTESSKKLSVKADLVMYGQAVAWIMLIFVLAAEIYCMA